MSDIINLNLEKNVGSEAYIYIDGGRSIEGKLVSVDRTSLVVKMKAGHTILDLSKIIGVTFKLEENIIEQAAQKSIELKRLYSQRLVNVRDYTFVYNGGSCIGSVLNTINNVKFNENTIAVYLRGVRKVQGGIEAGCDYRLNQSGINGTGYDEVCFFSRVKPGDIVEIDFDPIFDLKYASKVKNTNITPDDLNIKSVKFKICKNSKLESGMIAQLVVSENETTIDISNGMAPLGIFSHVDDEDSEYGYVYISRMVAKTSVYDVIEHYSINSPLYTHDGILTTRQKHSNHKAVGIVVSKPDKFGHLHFIWL